MRKLTPKAVALALALTAFFGRNTYAQSGSVSFDFDDGLVPAGTVIPQVPVIRGVNNTWLGVTNAGGFKNSGCLILTRPGMTVENQGHWWITTSLTGDQPVSGFTATFKLYMGNGSGGNAPVPNPGANGLVFHVGPQPPNEYPGSASTWGNGLDVNFRTYNSSSNTPGINIAYNAVSSTFNPGGGTLIGTNSFFGFFNTNGAADNFSEAVDVTLSVSNGLLNLTCSNAVIGNVVVYSNLMIPNFAPLSGPTGGPPVFGFTASDGAGGHEDAWIDNVSITAYAPSGPVAFVMEPVSQTAPENAFVTFSAAVTGELPYFYQWKSNNIPIPDATNATYTTPWTLYGMNGAAYSVTVSNNASSATSSNAILTITPDTTGVQVASVGSLNGASVGVQFSSYLDPATAGNPNNYLVNGVRPTAATVRTAFANYGNPVLNYANYQKTVVLTLASPVSGSFTVTVTSGVKSRTGLAVVQTDLTGRVEGVSDLDLGTPGTDPLAAGEAFSGGAGQIQVVGGGSNFLPIGGAGSADAGHFVYNGTPRSGNFDVVAKLTFETLTANNAKAGLMVRPLPRDASSPAIALKVFPPAPGNNTYETAMRASYGNSGVSWSAIGGNGNAPGNWTDYGANWMRLRRVGATYLGYASGDGLSWNLIGSTTPDFGSFPLEAEYVGLYVSAANNDGRLCEADFQNWGPLSFAGAVVTITNNLRASPAYVGYENARFTFTIGATLSNALANELTYQWQRKGPSDSAFADIVDGTGNASTLTTPLLSVANDNGTQYRVIAFVGDITTGHSATSAVATLSVQTDATAPYMTGAAADGTFQQVTITFDGSMEYGSTADPSHYTLMPVGGGAAIPITQALPTMNPDFTVTSVVLSLGSPLSAGVKYQLTVANVLDAAGNNINNTTVPGGKSRVITGWVLAYGYLKYERWNWPAGSSVTDLGAMLNFGSPFLANPPDVTQLISYSGYPNGDTANPSANVLDFGARISGFFIPPTTGSYQWYVRGNDACAIWVSADSTLPDPVSTVPKAAYNHSGGFASPGPSWIASQTNLADIGVSGNYPDTSPIAMASGQLYGLTALVKQGVGTSFLEFTCGTDGTTTWGGDSVANNAGGAFPTGTAPARGGASTNVYNLKGANIATYVNPDASKISATGPTNLFIEDRKTGTFLVSATAQVSAGGTPSSVGPVLYQWYSNNVLIAGATTAAYTPPTVSYPSPVVTYSVVLSVAGLPFMSITNSATLTVVPDTMAPFVVAASSFGGNTLCLRFDGPVALSSVTNLANYSAITGGAAVTGARLASDGVTVVLTLNQKLSGSSFSVTLNGVRDLAGNPTAGLAVTGSLQVAQIAGALDIGVGAAALGAGVVPLNSQPALTNLTFDVNYPGSTIMVTNGVFEIQASGRDLGNNQDGQQFIYEQRSGDFDIKVRVDALMAANNASKAGLMLRENLAPGSRRYNIVADPPNTAAVDGSGLGLNKVEVTMRTAADGASATWGNNPAPANLGTGVSATQVPGLWLRLKLVGRKLYAYTGADGTNWALAARENLASNWPLTNFYVGMCVTSRTNSLYTTARLSNYGEYTTPATKRALFLIGDEMNVPAGAPNATPSNTGVATPQQASDTRVWNTLIAMGYNVTATRNEMFQQEDIEGMSVVLWSSTGNSGGTGNPSLLTTLPVPLMVWESSAWNKLRMASADGNNTPTTRTTINITNTAGPTASVLSMGLSGATTVFATADINSRAAKSTLGAGAVIVAQQSDDASQAVMWAYEKGAAMTGANLAPHRRLSMFLNDTGAANLNSTGYQLFTNAILWTAAAQNEAPTILAPPANLTVVAESPATFVVTAVGPGPYSYQWARIVPGVSTNDIVGATNRDYTILAAAVADSGTSYRVTVTGVNSGLSVTSAAATLTVQAPIAITLPPQNQTAAVGSTATFTVTVTGTAPAYQWYSNAVAMAGATGSSYTTPVLTLAASSSQYYVVVTNLVSSVTSASATLTVVSAPPKLDPPIVRPDGRLVLSWTGGGLLLSATNITGPWTTNVGAASPYTNQNLSLPRQFFRIQQ